MHFLVDFGAVLPLLGRLWAAFRLPLAVFGLLWGSPWLPLAPILDLQDTIPSLFTAMD